MNVTRAVFNTMISVFAVIFIVVCCATVMYIFISALITGIPTVRLELDIMMEFKVELCLLSFLFVCFLYKIRTLFRMMFEELDKFIKEMET